MSWDFTNQEREQIRALLAGLNIRPQDPVGVVSARAQSLSTLIDCVWNVQMLLPLATHVRRLSELAILESDTSPIREDLFALQDLVNRLQSAVEELLEDKSLREQIAQSINDPEWGKFS